MDMSLRRTAIAHRHDGQALNSVLVDDPSWESGRPTVIVVHGGDGPSDHQVEFAERVVAMGCRALAVDLYGPEVEAGGLDRCLQEMNRFLGHRDALRDRLRHVVELAAGLDGGDPGRMAAMGYCFGGTCVLDLARIGAPVRGVASFHGTLTAPEQDIDPPPAEPVTARVLALHGWDDPFAPPQDVEALARELTARRADWQLHAFGGVMHAFMLRDVQDPERGVLHDPRAATRAWRLFTEFLSEVLDSGRLS